MRGQYKMPKKEEKKNIKVVDNEENFYVDIGGVRLEGVRKYDIVREAEKPPILKLEIILDEETYNNNLDCKSNA